MTEEIAEEYTKGLCKTCTLDSCRYNTLKTCAIKESLKQAFLAGLKAGRDMAETDLATVAYMQGAERYKPKWHKVADGDLPNTEREVLVFMWGSYYFGYYKQYDGEDSSWHFEDFDEESEQVIAWCEIPKYTEE